MQRIRVPTIREERAGHAKLVDLAQRLRDNETATMLDFTRCKFLASSAAAVIGGLVHMKQSGPGMALDVATFQPSVRDYLGDNGFLGAFGIPANEKQGDAVLYREYAQLDKDSLLDYLANEWLLAEWVNCSQKLRDSILGRLWELFANAFDHADSPVGITVCGQHYPTQKKLDLTIVDFGTGIPEKVRRYVNVSTLPANRALKWAFQSGTTTRPQTSRGLGLDLIKSFVKVNHGSLRIFSNDGQVLINDKMERYAVGSGSFQGTMVNIELQCDERYYRLASEPPRKPQF